MDCLVRNSPPILPRHLMKGLGSLAFICNYTRSCLSEINESIAKGWLQSVINHLPLGASQSTLSSWWHRRETPNSALYKLLEEAFVKVWEITCLHRRNIFRQRAYPIMKRCAAWNTTWRNSSIEGTGLIDIYLQLQPLLSLRTQLMHALWLVITRH